MVPKEKTFPLIIPIICGGTRSLILWQLLVISLVSDCLLEVVSVLLLALDLVLEVKSHPLRLP